MRLKRFLFRKYLEEDEQIFEVIHHHLDSILKPFAINFLILICAPVAGFIFLPNLSFVWLAAMIVRCSFEQQGLHGISMHYLLDVIL